MKSLELNINLYQQILELVKHLPKKELNKLIAALKKQSKRSKKESSENDLQNLILNAPTWSDKEYHNYLEARKHINTFRSK